MQRAFWTISATVIWLSSAFADSGWTPYLAVERSTSSEYRDVPGSPEYASTEWVFGTSAYNRTRGGQLAIDVAYALLDADWSGSGFKSETAFTHFQEVETVGGSVMWTGLPWQKWGYSVLLGTESSRVTKGPYASGGFGDALSYTMGAGINFRQSRDLMLGIVTLYSNPMAGIDDDWLVFPHIYWKINDAWTLATRQGLVLTWEQDSDSLSHEVIFSGEVADREWLLGNKASHEMSYEEEGFSLGVEYGLTLSGKVTVTPGVQYLFDREVTVWQDGKRAVSSDLENGFRYNLRVEYTF